MTLTPGCCINKGNQYSEIIGPNSQKQKKGGGDWGTSSVLIVLNTHQNFNYDMHTNFYVMANPIPIITLYRDPPETNEDINLQVNFRITHRYV